MSTITPDIDFSDVDQLRELLTTANPSVYDVPFDQVIFYDVPFFEYPVATEGGGFIVGTWSMTIEDMMYRHRPDNGRSLFDHVHDTIIGTGKKNLPAIDAYGTEGDLVHFFYRTHIDGLDLEKLAASA